MAGVKVEKHESPERSARAVEIRKTAAKIFHEKGYEATSIQDIADAVGILKGSLYYYIDSKEDLLFDVIRSAHDMGLEDAENWSSSDAPPAERLRAAIRQHVISNLSRLVEVGVFFHDFRSLSPERRTQIIADRDYYDAQLRQIVIEGQDSGVFDAGQNAKLVVLGMLGMMNWVYQWYSPDGPQSAEAIADSFADLILRGLVVREADAARSGPSNSAAG